MSESLVQAKLNKLRALRCQGTNPYPARVTRTHTIGEVTTRFSELVPEERSGKQATITGRVVAFRRMGKASFFDLRDETEGRAYD
jgi:lysyl-tRNA synthetase class 2